MQVHAFFFKCLIGKSMYRFIPSGGLAQWLRLHMPNSPPCQTPWTPVVLFDGISDLELPFSQH